MTHSLISYFAPLGRVLLASLFIISGVSKLFAYAGTQAYMESVGLPGALLPAVIAFEIIAPLALVFGFYSRFAAFLLAGFSLVTAVVFHNNIADQIQFILLMKNVSIAGGLLLVVSQGPGVLSANES